MESRCLVRFERRSRVGVNDATVNCEDIASCAGAADGGGCEQFPFVGDISLPVGNIGANRRAGSPKIYVKEACVLLQCSRQSLAPNRSTETSAIGSLSGVKRT